MPAADESRRLGPWAATAMVVTNVVGVGIFLTPAAVMRSTGSAGGAIALWAALTLLTLSGALCYAELTTRFPRAGGAYVFLREAFGPRVAFVHGWVSALIVDPGLTAALGVGMSQYLLAAVGASSAWRVPVACAAIAAFAALAARGVRLAARVMMWTAAAKLAAVAGMVVATALVVPVPESVAEPSPAGVGWGALAGGLIAGFFAFGGWWELGRLAGDVKNPGRTMPRALVVGTLTVGVIYVLATLGLRRAVSVADGRQAEELVLQLARTLFGNVGSTALAVVVVLSVGGSLAATLFGAPRLYLAMAQDGLFPPRLARFDAQRAATPALTAFQGALACVYAVLGSFDQILGYFVPAAVLFLGLSVVALLRLPRPTAADVFRVPLYPLPLALFLSLVGSVLLLMAVGQPGPTLVGGLVTAFGYLVARRMVDGTPRRPAST